MNKEEGYLYQKYEPTPDNPCEIITRKVGKNLLDSGKYFDGNGLPKLVGITKEEYLEYQSLLNIKEKMIQLHCYLESGDFKSNFESINNEVYIRAKIKDIIGLSMSEEEFEILKNKYYKIDIRPSFTIRKLNQLEQENKQLKDNWSKLKENIKRRKEKFDSGLWCDLDTMRMFNYLMQELEKGEMK